MVLIKSVHSEKDRSPVLRRTACDNIMNLIEAFHFDDITRLVYNLDLFNIPLFSVLCQSGNSTGGRRDRNNLLGNLKKDVNMFIKNLSLAIDLLVSTMSF
jgi:hypothetical protein